MVEKADLLSSNVPIMFRFWRALPASVLVAALAAIALTVTFVIVSEKNHQNITFGIDAVRIERDKLDLIDDLQTLLLNAETGQRGRPGSSSHARAGP